MRVREHILTPHSENFLKYGGVFAPISLVTFLQWALMIVLVRALASHDLSTNLRTLAMKFIRIRQVMQITGLSRMTIYRLELAGNFPKRRKLSQNSVAWREEEVEQWLNSRPVADLRSVAPAALLRRG